MTVTELEEAYQQLRDQLLNGDINDDSFRAMVEMLRYEACHIPANLLDRVKKDTVEIAKVESEPRFEGRQIVMVLAPR